MAFRHIVAAGVLGIVASTAANADSITYANFLSTAGLTLQGSGSYDDSSQSSSPCLVNNVAGSAGFCTCITQIYQKGPNAVEPFANPFGEIDEPRTT